MARRLSMNGTWQLTWTVPDALPAADAEWIEAAVPGEVHLDLMRAGVIPDPYLGTNFRQCLWMEQSDFWFRTEISVPADVDRNLFLRFEGLDTFATVWVNGVEVGRTRNMFIPHEFDVRGVVHPGERNQLFVRLAGPISHVKRGPDFPQLPIDVSAVPAIFTMPWRLFSRKMQMSYGWDNVPRLVTTGIFRPVTLLAYGPARIADIHLTSAITEPDATVKATIVVEQFSTVENLSVQLTLTDADGRRVGDHTLPLTATGDDGRLLECRVVLPITDARLWWPYQMGEPHLYTVDVTLTAGEAVLDRSALKHGIRSIRVVTEPAEERWVTYRVGRGVDPMAGMDGGQIGAWNKVPLDAPQPETVRPFRVEVNGRPLFIKGVNWQPPDALLPLVSDRRYEVLLERVHAANLNLVRVWGGGVPEDDRFYDLCDRLGLLVWQDFPFACALYPQEDWFAREIEVEAAAIITRLRNRASLAIWCGDNEGDMMAHDRGEDPPVVNRLSHSLLPSVLARLDPTRFYHPSSPSGGSYPRSPWAGDKRNWGAAFPRDFYAHIRGDEGRFISEGGSYSLPGLATIRAAIPEAERWPVEGSEAWYYHLGNVPGTHRGFERQLSDYVRRYFGEPSSLEDYVWLSQYAQAHGYKAFVEHFRRRRGDCGGFAIWKYADTWPCGCMSMIDYKLANKISYDYTHRACAPLLVSFRYVADSFEVWGVNDDAESWTGMLAVSLVDFQRGTVQPLVSEPQQISADSARCLTSVPITDLDASARQRHGLVAHLKQGGAVLARNLQFLDDVVRLHLPVPEAGVSNREIAPGVVEVVVHAATFVRDVDIDVPEVEPADVTLTDNHFPLLAGEIARVRVVGPTSMPRPRVTLR